MRNCVGVALSTLVVQEKNIYFLLLSNLEPTSQILKVNWPIIGFIIPIFHVVLSLVYFKSFFTVQPFLYCRKWSGDHWDGFSQNHWENMCRQNNHFSICNSAHPPSFRKKNTYLHTSCIHQVTKIQRSILLCRISNFVWCAS